VDEVTRRADAAGVSVRVLGDTEGERLTLDGAFDVAVADAAGVWRDAIPKLMAH
jgi:hypothetical protein